MNSEHTIARAPRPLTAAELDAVAAGIRAATSIPDLVGNLVHTLYGALLGRPVTSLPAGTLVDPQQFAIPASQWNAIVTAAGAQVARWGTAELLLAVVDVMPARYQDPAMPAPDLNLDLPPAARDRHLSSHVEATIQECTAHVDALGAYFGTESATYRRAADSWARQVCALFVFTLAARLPCRPVRTSVPGRRHRARHLPGHLRRGRPPLRGGRL